MKRGQCPYANRQASASALRCSALRGEDAKWDFCTHQYFCRVSGKYELRSDAVGCGIKNKSGKESG